VHGRPSEVKEETVSPTIALGKNLPDYLDWGTVASPPARLVYHDLRHPLTAILAYAEFLAQGDLKRSEREEFHREICLAVSRMNDLISSLLEVSKDGSARRPRLAEIVSTIACGIRTVAVRPEFRRIAVRYEHAGVTEGWFDPGGLQQAITNIVLNACEAVSPASGRVDVRSLGGQNHVEISVADNGPGIPAPIRHGIFQPFVSCDKTGGTGLGLAIAQKILRDHGGDVYLDATGESGTVFRLVLPPRATETGTSALDDGRLALDPAQENGQGANVSWADYTEPLTN
jgi:signal transduction histidine kinase